MLVPLVVVELEQDSYHLLVRAKINGNEAYLIVDTGASSSVIDCELAQQANACQLGETVAYSFTSDNVNVKVINIPNMELDGGAHFNNVMFAIADLSKLRELYAQVSGYSIAGLLGSNFLLTRCSSINLKKKTLSVNNRCLAPMVKINS